jgi:VIT1/CCC1 family predicted Fe2+/Mn2+ transporter
VRELVFGAQDGLISTVTVAATIMAATQNSTIAIIAGMGSAMAGTISMAAGTYLGSRATSQMEQGEIEMEQAEIARNPDEEHAELIATYRHDGYSYEEAERLADRLMQDSALTLQVMAERELGITPEAPQDPRKDALVMGASYTVGALLPLAAYVFRQDDSAVILSVMLTLIALAVVGLVKARIAYRPVLSSVAEVTGIGAASGTLGYLLGEYLPRLFGAGS